MENFLSSNEVFTIDLSASLTPADVVFELSQFLDDSNSFGKKVYLKLANMDLSQAQLLSLKSLISSINSELAYIECPSDVTVASAQAIGIETPNNLPENVDLEHIEAKYENGLLKVTLPKKEDQVPACRQIAIG